MSQPVDSIVFDLDQSFRSPSPTAKTLQQEAVERVREAIDRQLPLEVKGGVYTSKDPKDCDPAEHVPVHSAILVDGSRGSGKTTFLHGLRNMSNGIFGNLHFLPPIDPGLLESREHPLITLLARIKNAVEQSEAHKRSVNRREQHARRLRELARHLTALDDVGKPALYEGWEDADVVVDELLDRATGGAKLAAALSAYIDEALACLEKRAVVVVLDDVDTHFSVGWPVLEMIRRYLTSSRIVVLLAGDFELYTKLVRRAQYRNLGDEVLRHERPHRDHHPEVDRISWEEDPMRKLVGALESQYLLKVLRPENRVTLKSLHGITAGGSKVTLRYTDSAGRLGDSQPELREFLGQVLKRALRLQGTAQCSEHVDAVLQLPVRTVAQLLRVSVPIFGVEDPGANLLRKYREDFLDVAASALLRYGIRPLDLKMADSWQAAFLLVQWMTKADAWEDGHELRPQYKDGDKNLVVMCFAMRFVQLFEGGRGVADAIGYMLRVCLARSVVLQCADAVVRARVLMFLQHERKQPLHEVGRRLVVAQRYLLAPKASVERGTIPVVAGRMRTFERAAELLYGPVPTSDGKKSSSRDKWNVSVFRECVAKFGVVGGSRPEDSLIGPWLKEIKGAVGGEGWAYNTVNTCLSRSDYGRDIALAAVRHRSGNATYQVLSSVVLLGVIGSLCDSSESVGLDELRNVPTYDLHHDSPQESKAAGKPLEGDLADDDDQAYDKRGSDVHESSDGRDYKEWWEKVRGSAGSIVGFHPFLLANTIRRYDQALDSMSEEFGPADCYAGTLLKRHVTAVLNAVLVECWGESAPPRIQRNSPITTDRIYLHNHKLYDGRSGADGDVGLFRWLYEAISRFPFIVRLGVGGESEPISWDLPGRSVRFSSLEFPFNSIPVSNRVLLKRSIFEVPSTSGPAKAAEVKSSRKAPGTTVPVPPAGALAVVDVELLDIGPSRDQVIEVVSKMLGLDFDEAKALIEGSPKVLVPGAEKADAQSLVDKLIEVGANAAVKDVGS